MMTPARAAAFWRFPEAEDEQPGPATDEQIDRFNHQHGIELPNSFAVLYKHQNGGGTRLYPDAFWSIDDEQCPVASLATIAGWTDDDDAKAFWRSTFLCLGRVIVFFGDGHFYFGLNYDDCIADEPSVWYITNDSAQSTGKTFEQWIAEAGQ